MAYFGFCSFENLYSTARDAENREDYFNGTQTVERNDGG
jgi:hypothetical protein